MTLWAIQCSPLHGGRGKPWLHSGTVSSTRRGAWALFVGDNATAYWLKEIKRRQRKGILRAVKVTLQLQETP